jgi:hypothetical protein
LDPDIAGEVMARRAREAIVEGHVWGVDMSGPRSEKPWKRWTLAGCRTDGVHKQTALGTPTLRLPSAWMQRLQSVLHPDAWEDLQRPQRSAHIDGCDLWAEDSRGGGAWSVAASARTWNTIALLQSKHHDADVWDAPLVQLFWLRLRDALRALAPDT